MRKGLYPLLAGVLISLWLVVEVFESQINALPAFAGVALLVFVAFVAIGAVLLALWDTKVIGKK